MKTLGKLFAALLAVGSVAAAVFAFFNYRKGKQLEEQACLTFDCSDDEPVLVENTEEPAEEE